MKRHFGSSVPIALAEPVLRVFHNAPPGIHVTAPVWGAKADDRHLVFEICITGTTPGLYTGRTVRSVDLTQEARVLELEAQGMTSERARQSSRIEARENDPDWRLHTNRRLTMEERADIVQRWTYALLEGQIVMQQRAKDAFPEGAPDLEVPDDQLRVDHVILDAWTAKRLSDHPEGPVSAVREEIRHVLQSPATACGRETALLRRQTEEGMRTTRLRTLDSGPSIRVQRTVSNEEGILTTFDGRDLAIYGLTGERMTVPLPDDGTKLGAWLDIEDEDLASRNIVRIRRAGPGQGGPSLVIGLEPRDISVGQIA